MEGASFQPASRFPAATDQIEVRLAGAADKTGVGQLTDLAGGNIGNPFAVADAPSGTGGFGFKPAAAGRYDVLNLTTGEYLARDWWIEDDTKLTGRELIGFTEGAEALQLVAGVGALNCAAAKNGQDLTFTQVVNAVTTTNRVVGKPFVFAAYHDGVAGTLTIDGIDVLLQGVAGDYEEWYGRWDGALWRFTPPVVMNVGVPA